MHGLGGRQDLPLPFELVVVGAALALVVSFVVLSLARTAPRPAGPGVPLGATLTRVVDSAGLAWTVRGVGLLLTGFMAAALLFGKDLATNPVFGYVYVWVWVGLVPLSLLLGPVWRLLNPVRSTYLLVAGLQRVGAPAGAFPLPAWVGRWPAVAGLFAFVWLELAAPDRVSIPVVLLWFAAYAVVMGCGLLLFGLAWIDAADPFETYALTVARLSPWARREDGQLRLRSPLTNLAGLDPQPGTVAFVAVLIGSTGFDGFSGSGGWLRWTQDSALPGVVAGTLGLLAFSVLVGLSYVAACRAAAGITGTSARPLPGLFVHTLVPIALGYVTAHYLTLLILEGQRVLLNASDPFSRGWDLLGTSGRQVDTTIANHPGLVGVIQAGAVVAGHVIGVFAAHDRALARLPRAGVVRGQVPMLVVMVGYTVAALLLLFNE